MIWTFVPKEAEDPGTRGLIWTAPGDRPCHQNEQVETGTEYGDREDKECNGGVGIPKVFGQSAAEQQECHLQYQRQRLHHMIEIPSNNPIQLPLPILAAFDCGPSHVDRGISVQPLLAERREKSGEERGGETCVEESLYLDEGGRGI